MFRFGIRQIGQFSPRVSGLSGQLRHLLTRGCISYELLGAVSNHGVREVEVFEKIVRDLRLTCGVCRTTARGRFATFNPQVNRILLQQFHPGQNLVIHDWAASDCLTSSEWAESLFASTEHSGIKVIASDLLLYLAALSVGNSGDLFILEPSGDPLQYSKGPFVCQLDRPEPPHALVNRVLAGQARQFLNKNRESIAAGLKQLEQSDTVQAGELQFRRLPLIHPDALALQERDPRFSIRRHSAFDALDKPVEAVRTMNIFNRGYFGPDVLEKGAKTVWNSLIEGGVWIVGRTTPGMQQHHTATVFQKHTAGFTVLQSFEGGSEIEDLVLQLRPVEQVF